MVNYTLYIGGEQIHNATLPLKYGKFLDEQLDHATLGITRLKFSSGRKAFVPTSPVKIVIESNNTIKGVEYNQTETLYYIVANDNFKESPVGTGEFRHNLTLIEPTKLLEGIPVESLCVTNAGGKGYLDNPIVPYLEIRELDGGIVDPNPTLPNNIKTPMKEKNVTLPGPRAFLKMESTYDFYNFYATISVINSQGLRDYNVSDLAYEQEETTVNIELEKGENTIIYSGYFQKIGSGSKKNFNIVFSILVAENKYPLAPWTIKDVIDRVFDLERPLLYLTYLGRYSKPPRFTLQIPEGKEEVFYQNAPEFTFTRQSLREVLQTIGGYIHAEPRLLYNEQTKEFDTVTFDFYGEQEYATYHNTVTGEETRLSEYVYEGLEGSYGIEQACTALDSYVDNLVNQLKASSATVGQPYEGGKQTLRTESANVRLEEGNMFLPTAYPIYKVHKLYWIDADNLVGNGANTAYDLTPHLYESNVYNSLSSYDDVYPVSKAYALYYTQEQKGIQGFFFKNPDITGGALVNYAIVNVIKAATSYEITSGNYTGLCFRVEYTPVYSARIGHSKQYIGDWLKYPRSLNYSQGANMVETEYYGENIKGAVERLGNIELVYTFTCFNLETIPKAGQLWDDEYYIVSVSVEVMHDKFKVSVGLSKNFNRISQYVGVQSHKRIYEVSEVMVQARETMYKDYMVITNFGFEYNAAPPDRLIKGAAIHAMVATFTQDESRFENYDGSLFSPKAVKVTAKGYSKNFSPLTTVTLPVIASAEGNVMEFSWEYKDNFSAGLESVPITVNGAQNYYTQDVQYADYYGRIYYERFSILSSGYDGRMITSITDGGPGVGRYSFPRGIANGHELIGNYVSGNEHGWSYLLRRKDSREAMKNNYSIEFVTDQENFIIGSGLASTCPLVVGLSGKRAVLVLLRKRINKFTRLVDLSTENVIETHEVENNDITIESLWQIVMFPKTRETAETAGIAKAWAYVTPIYYGEPYTVEDEDGTTKTITPKYGGELLVGCNAEINFGEEYGGFTMCATHDIYDFLRFKN